MEMITTLGVPGVIIKIKLSVKIRNNLREHFKTDSPKKPGAKDG